MRGSNLFDVILFLSLFPLMIVLSFLCWALSSSTCDDNHHHSFFCLGFFFYKEGENVAFAEANLQSSSVLSFAPCFSDNLSVGLFFVRANWNNPASSANIDESWGIQGSCWTSLCSCLLSGHYTLKEEWTVSHGGNHAKNGTHCLLCGKTRCFYLL